MRVTTSTSSARPPDRPRVRPLLYSRSESRSVKTFGVEDPHCSNSKPGQFSMVWVPGEGEIPLSISSVTKSAVEFSVKKVGPVTSKLHRFHEGDKVGIRGPYGNFFSPPSRPEETILLAGGGCGIVPLRYYRNYYGPSYSSSLLTIIGASTEDELLFFEQLSPRSVATEDGSRGWRGTILKPFADTIDNHEIDRVITAGPEKMLTEIVNKCNAERIPVEASLERMMKCGIGICGSCLIDGFRVCRDGPVFSTDQLNEMDEFGHWKRNKSGAREKL